MVRVWGAGWGLLVAAAAAAAPLTGAQLDDLAVRALAQPVEGLHAWQDAAARTPATDPRRWELLLGQGVTAARLGLTQTGEAVQAELAPRQPQAAACVQAEFARRRGSTREALDLLPPDPLPPTLPAAVRYQCAMTAALSHDARGAYDRALSQYQAAMAAADAMGSAWRRATTRYAMTLGLARGGHVDEAQRLSDEALLIAREAGLDVVVGEVLDQRWVMTPKDAAHAAERERMLRDAVAAWQRVDAQRHLAMAWIHVSKEALLRGDAAAARDAASQAHTLGQSLKLTPSVQDAARFQLGLALVAQGELAPGLAQLRDAITSRRDSGAVAPLADMLLEAGQALEAQGQYADAYAFYAQHRSAWAQLSRELHQQALADLQARQDDGRRRAEHARLAGERVLRDEQLAQQRLRLQLWSAAGVASLLLALLAAVGLGRMRRRAHALALAHDEARRRAQQDALTGVASRSAAEAHMSGQGLAAHGLVMLIDVDHFKRINDSHGHAAGDAVLVGVAQRLQAALRTGDLLARWGGEEFLVLAATDAPRDAMALAHRLLAQMADPPQTLPGGGTRSVTISIGLAVLPATAHQPWSRALAVADAALYGAKLLGRAAAIAVGDLSRAPIQPPRDAAAADALCDQGVWVLLRAMPADAGPPR